MNTRPFQLTLLCLILLLIGPTLTSTADRVPDAILIGATVSESGRFLSEVGPFRRLMESWADLVNKQGGILVKEYGKRLPVKFIVYDDKSDEATANKYYERLATLDKVHVLLGPYSSPLTFAGSAAGENHQTPFIGICANSPRIYSRGFKWIGGLIDLGPRYTYRYWDMMRAEGKAKTISFVVENTLHPLGVYEGSKKMAEESGLKVLSSDIIPSETHDFTPVITKIRDRNPDIVYVSCNVPFAVNFMKQAREMKLNPREYHCIHHSGVFRDALGDASEYVVGQSYWVKGMKLGDIGLISDVLRPAKISEAMYPWSPAYIAAFQILQAAIEKAGTLDKKNLMETLKSLKVETVLGPSQFHETGYGSINTYPSQIQEGQYVVIWPPEVATGKHVYPRPPWK